jgi:hypothetical protein
MQDNFALSGHHVMHQKGLSGCRGEMLGSCGAGIAGAEHCSKKGRDKPWCEWENL